MKNQKNYTQGERASFHGSVGWSRYKLATCIEYSRSTDRVKNPGGESL